MASHKLSTIHVRSKRGSKKHPLYVTWKRMRQRCYNQTHHKFPIYGQRGVQICERWRDNFWAFVSDMGPKPTPKHTIERIDNNGDYEPDNCKWATKAEQARNMRANRRLTVRGRTMIMADWARETGIPANKIGARLKRGWTPEEAMA
jgi:hypothetical protein